MMQWAKDDQSVVPGGERTKDGAVWSLVLRGYFVTLYAGAYNWRASIDAMVKVAGSREGILTPSVFVSALEAHQWAVDWLNGKRYWDKDWGRTPNWPPVRRSRLRKETLR